MKRTVNQHYRARLLTGAIVSIIFTLIMILGVYQLIEIIANILSQ